MRNDLPIGVFDSGVGGLTVVAALMQELPDERIFYFGDTARCPYGNRDPEEILQFSLQVMDFLYRQGVKFLVIACNTATAVALPYLQARYDVPVLGVIQPGARAACDVTKHGKIGVIGTAVTIASGAYQSAIEARLSSAKVYNLACPAFVPLVERGLWEGELVEETVRESLAPMVHANIDTLILGCTHYPMLRGVIQRQVGADVAVISSAQETAREAKQILRERGGLWAGDKAAQDVYHTTGDGSKLRRALTGWLHLPYDSPKIVLYSVESLTSGQSLHS